MMALERFYSLRQATADQLERDLFGPGDDGEPTAQEWADALGTISYDIVARFAARLPRTYRAVASDQGLPPGLAGLAGTPAR